MRDAKTLFNQAMKVSTAGRLDAFIETLEREHGAIKRPVGDTEGNAGAMRIANDASSALAELITNAFDATIEQARLVARVKLASITEGARLVGVPEGGVAAMSRKQRRALAARVGELTLLDSDESFGAPTVSIRDFGTGVTRDEFNRTLGSLHQVNKMRAAHQHGQFGQGAQQSWPYSKQGGMIITRASAERLAGSFSDQDEIQLVALRWEKASPDAKQLTLYYWVAADGMPLTVPAEGLDFEPGVERRLINYELGYAARVSPQSEKSLAAKLQSTLVDPAFPWIYKDARTGEANKDDHEAHVNGQTMSGLRIKLNDSANLQTDRTCRERIDIAEMGAIDMELFSFAEVNQLRRSRAHSQTLLMTVNGQTHAYLSSSQLRDRCPSIQRAFDNVSIIVDCAGIYDDVRFRLFSSSRDSLDRGEMGEQFLKALTEQLNANESLLALERELESAALRKVEDRSSDLDPADIERFQEQLGADFSGSGLRGHRRTPTEVAPHELSMYPQQLTGPTQITLVQGQERITRSFLTMARDNFVPSEGEASLTFPGAEPPVGVTWHPGAHLRGKLPMIFTVDDDAPEGSFDAELTLTWTGEDDEPCKLTHAITLEVCATPAESGDDAGTDGDDDVSDNNGQPVLLTLDNDYEDFNETVAGDFKRMHASLVAERSAAYAELASYDGEVDAALINVDYAPLKVYLVALAAARKDHLVEQRQREYASLVGAQVAITGMRERQLSESDIEAGLTRDQQKRVFNDIALSVVRAMSTRDDVVIQTVKPKRRRKGRSAEAMLAGDFEQARDDHGRFA